MQKFNHYFFFADHQGRHSLRDWLSPLIAKPLIISIGIILFQRLCGFTAVIFNAASIFKVAGFKYDNLVSIAVGFVQVFGSPLTCFIVDRAGRRILLLAIVGNCHVRHSCRLWRIF